MSMKTIFAIPLLILLWPPLLCQPADAQLPKQRPSPLPSRRFQTPPPIEFLGWDYAKLGYRRATRGEVSHSQRSGQLDARS